MDLGLLVLLVRSGSPPTQANLPSLFAGSTLQFLGNRYWVFRAGHRPLGKQLLLFVVAEAIAFFLNWLGFDLLVRHTSIYYPLARPVTVTLVFFGFSYPAWKWVFRSAMVPPSAV
jgi:putative flippase GtrA